ncbi:hypothetical protein OXYTRIMIC_610 [Oxytricha trifallax]|uniref:Uncharacterized protein n=1 Tax=Oxytricha trifallax TaxID=1172189 RepID=A0A073HYT6_9SPIT|nr:hypothetical protein OXYTRIMIC_610 [Oxytricha trifallax]
METRFAQIEQEQTKTNIIYMNQINKNEIQFRKNELALKELCRKEFEREKQQAQQNIDKDLTLDVNKDDTLQQKPQKGSTVEGVQQLLIIENNQNYIQNATSSQNHTKLPILDTNNLQYNTKKTHQDPFQSNWSESKPAIVDSHTNTHQTQDRSNLRGLPVGSIHQRMQHQPSPYQDKVSSVKDGSKQRAQWIQQDNLKILASSQNFNSTYLVNQKQQRRTVYTKPSNSILNSSNNQKPSQRNLTSTNPPNRQQQ